MSRPRRVRLLTIASMTESLEKLLCNARIWRAGQGERAAKGIPTGYAGFDEHLATDGWPAAALTEILIDQPGCGELQLVMPALAALSADDNAGSSERRWLMWIAPPYIPYAPALTAAGVNLDRVMVVHAREGMDALWAAEQSLRSGNCAAVLAWVKRTEEKKLRRLQLAAAQGDSWGIVFRPTRAARENSPAALRVMLGASHNARTLHILKNRGGRPATIAADFLSP